MENQITNVKSAEKTVPIKWKNKVVITTSLLAHVYETDENNIKNNFNNHKQNFQEGKHYYFLIGEELKEFKRLVNDIDEALAEKIKFAPSFTCGQNVVQTGIAKSLIQIRHGNSLTIWKKRTLTQRRRLLIDRNCRHRCRCSMR